MKHLCSQGHPWQLLLITLGVLQGLRDPDPLEVPPAHVSAQAAGAQDDCGEPLRSGGKQASAAGAGAGTCPRGPGVSVTEPK